MDSLSSDRDALTDAGTVGLGVLAGAGTALVTDGLLPPALVAGVAFAVIAIERRFRAE